MNEEQIRRAARVVKEGGLIVYPTDTVYGLGCDPFNRASVTRLFEAKGRGSKPIPILCGSLELAAKVVSLDSTALGLARDLWPGALTIVAPGIREFPYQVDQGTGEVGVRVPAREDSIKLIIECGGYLSGTSANVSGSSSCQTAQDAFRELGAKVDIVLDGGPSASEGSTVVRVRGSDVEVLRNGLVRIPSGYRVVNSPNGS